MTQSAGLLTPPPERLRFLEETVLAEATLLRVNDGRLFAMPMNAQRALTLRHDIELAERVDAFVARFGRLQDSRGHLAVPLLEAAARSLAHQVLSTGARSAVQDLG